MTGVFNLDLYFLLIFASAIKMRNQNFMLSFAVTVQLICAFDLHMQIVGFPMQQLICMLWKCFIK